jgi:HEPN domain-containing protein
MGVWEFGSRSSDIICFHYQQAVEKYLKGLLIQFDIKFQKTHDLDALAELVARKFPEIVEFKESLAKLSDYAVEVRYPDEFYTPTADDVNDAMFVTNQLRKFCLARMNVEK